jgi:acetylornithine deacetylase/succinyl-diaminopimelate desuccinylase-like protein
MALHGSGNLENQIAVNHWSLDGSETRSRAYQPLHTHSDAATKRRDVQIKFYFPAQHLASRGLRAVDAWYDGIGMIIKIASLLEEKGMIRRWFPVFVAVLFTLFHGTNARAQMPTAQPDLTKISTEAQGWLSDIIKMNTSNPPGNETQVAKYIAAIFQKEGINNEVLEIAPGRSIVVGRLQAGPLPDQANALLLVAHQDTVGVDPKKWTVDPFGAMIRDGYLYGRGSVDDKSMLAANIATIVQLKRSNARLARDIIFLATDDEEQGGPASIKTAIEKYWDKFACGFALNEGGRVMLKDGKVQYVGIQASEKVSYNVTVTASGPSGHASMPRQDNAVVHLAAAIAKLGAYQVPAQPNTITLRYFEQLSKVEDDEIAKWMRALEQSARQDLAVKHLSESSPMWNSMLRDSITPTILQAGVRNNVIPSEATANLNIRMLPGHSIDELIGQLEKVVADPQIKFRLAADPGENAPPSDITSPLYQLIERITPQEFPGAIALPFLSTGATDSASLRLHKVQAFGLLPFPLSEADDARMHGDDERIPLDSFRKGIGFLYHVVSDFASSK